ncbi:MAG TPA: hypothetical protein VI072_31860 [Polyangiaceae bacterium]
MLELHCRSWLSAARVPCWCVAFVGLLAGCGDQSSDFSGERVGVARAALSVGAEQRLGPSETLPMIDGVAHVAFGGSQFMVFGTDEHSRITLDGMNLEPDGAPHALPQSTQFVAGKRRAIAHDGTSFIALSSAEGSTVGTLFSTPSILGVDRVSNAGTPIDTTRIEREPIAVTGADLACGPGHCLAVYWSLLGHGVHLMHFTTGATIVAKSTISLPSVQHSYHATVRFDGTSYLVAYARHDSNTSVEEDRYVWQSVRVSATGQLLDATPRKVDTAPVLAGAHALASNGQGFLLLLPDTVGTERRLVAHRFNNTGEVSGAPITVAHLPLGALDAGLASDGIGYRALWRFCASRSTGNQPPPSNICFVQGADIDPISGAVTAVQKYGAANSFTTPPQLVWGGGQYLAVWDQGTFPEFLARRLAASGAVLDRQVVLPKAVTPDDSRAAVAWNGCDYLAAYGHTSRPFPQVVGTRISATGDAIGAQPFLMGTYFAGQLDAHELVPASGGLLWLKSASANDYLQLPSYFYGANRVTLTGEVLESPAIYPATFEPNVPKLVLRGAAPKGSGWMAVVTSVAFDGYARRPGGADVVVQDVAATGEVGTMHVVTNAPGDQVLPSIAAGAAGFFVAWRDRTTPPAVRGRALTSAGAVAGQEFLLGTASTIELAPRVASDGSGYLVAWDDPSGVRAQTFVAGGASAGPVITLGDPSALDRVLYDGRTYLVFYKQPTSSQSFVRRISRAGALLDAGGVELGTANLRGAASDGLGRTLITYDGANGRAMRRFLTAADAAPPPATCQPPSGTCSYSPSSSGVGGLGAWLAALGLSGWAMRQRRAKCQL